MLFNKRMQTISISNILRITLITLIAVFSICQFGSHYVYASVLGSTSSSNQISTCGSITQSGTYTLSQDLTSTNTCITISGTSGAPLTNVTLDCAGHSITMTTQSDIYSAISTSYANAITITNCTVVTNDQVGSVADAISVDNDNGFTFTNNTLTCNPITSWSVFTISNSQNGIINNNTINGEESFIRSSNNIQITNNQYHAGLSVYHTDNSTIDSNVFKLRNNTGMVGIGEYIEVEWGSNNTISNNAMDGGWDGVARGYSKDTGFDDGIVWGSEAGDSVINNTISNIYDCGIENIGVIQNSVISGNKITTAGTCGIGGWYWSSLLNNNIKNNTVDQAPEMFAFTRIYGLQSTEQYVYFENNTFDSNIFTNQRNGETQASNGGFINLGLSPSSSITPSQTKYDNNIFENNNFGVSVFSPFINPPSLAVDKGNNICKPLISPDTPLNCITPVISPNPTPLTTPSPTPIPSPKISVTPTPVPIFTPPPLPTITPTPTPSVAVLGITVFLHGIGKGGDNISPNSIGNTSPRHPRRTITITFLSQQNQISGSTKGTVNYSNISGNFQGFITSNVPSGTYIIKVALDGFLPNQTSTPVSITAGKTISIPSFSLTNGNINNTGSLDILNYNILISCYGSAVNTSICPQAYRPSAASSGADIDDDGIVDGGDYNLFLRELHTQ
ncbi:MAG TPA: right-handed parallel beta-helix repeat-containing protein [Patescibacteria group bacterium]|nr:right-handed parallel beta-helix repeat-containing protein [Patescibacteria group bacterium]